MLTSANHNKFRKCTSNKSKHGNNFWVRREKLENRAKFSSIYQLRLRSDGEKSIKNGCKAKKENCYLMIFKHLEKKHVHDLKYKR